MKKNKMTGFGKKIKTSVFVNVLGKISDYFHTKICTSKTAQLFTSYEALDYKSCESFTSKLIGEIKPRKKSVIKVKNAFSGRIENSLIFKLAHKLVDIALGTKLRVYGIVAFVLGVMSAAIGVIERFITSPSVTNTTLLWQGLAFIVFSIPLLASKEELCTSLVDGPISRSVVHFIGFKDEDVIRPPVDENFAIPALVGVFLGVCTVSIEPVYFILVLLAAIYFGMILKKPEFSVIVTVATLPFLPTMVICAEVIITALSFFFKVIRGKRTLKFDLLDAFVLIFAVFMFFGGVFSVTPSASIPPACVFICFIFAYFLIVNLIKTKELVKKLLYSSMASFVLCSLYGIYQNFFATPDTTWTDEDMFSDIETRVVSTFENPNVFGEYLIMLIPVALALVIVFKAFSERSFALVALASAILALVYTWSRGAWLGCIASMIIFFVIINRKALGMYIIGILAVPLAIPMLPASIIERFSSIGNMTDSSTSYRVFIWEASLKMIKDYFISGIGIGTTAFQTVYSEYALAGIETAPHSHNLYLQLLLELGIFGFAVFVFTMFLFFSKIFTFLKNSDNREAKLISGAIACGLLAILAQGLTDYVWYNYRVFAFFWMMLALAVSTVNTYKTEERPIENLS